MKKIPKLTPEEEAKVLEDMRAFRKRRESIPPSERVPISNPDKYNFPLGIGPDGKPFPNEAAVPKQHSNGKSEDN